MDRLTRRELKKDRFAQEVGHTVEFLGRHRKKFIVYGIAAVALVLILAGLFYYNRRQHEVRQTALRAAMDVMDAPVGPSPGMGGVLTFASAEEKQTAVTKALNDLAARHSGSNEGAIAKYYLGTQAMSRGKPEEAVKLLNESAGSGQEGPASLARLALAGVYAGQGKTDEAEKLLRSLVERPTMLVPQEEAAIALARLIAPTRPEEARKLLEPLLKAPGPAGRAAITAQGELFGAR